MTPTTLFLLALALAAGGWSIHLWRRLRRVEAETGGSTHPAPEPVPAGSDTDGAADPGIGSGAAGSDDPVRAYRRELRNILDRVPDAFFHLDSRWRTTFLNEGARLMLERMGMSEDDLLGEPFWDVIPEPYDDEGRRMLERVMEERTTERRESYYDPLGAWIESRAFPSHEGVAVYVGDVTDRKEAERRLRTTERRLRTILENASEAIMVVDMAEERIVEMNENVMEIFGRTEEEVRQTAPFQFSPERQPDGSRSVNEARERIARAMDGEPQEFEWVHLTGDGRKIHTEVRLARIPADDGRDLLQANVRDVTDRKRTQQALRESEKRYRTLFEQDVAGNFVTAPDGRILECNPAFARIFGFASVEDAVGSDAARLHASPEQRDRLLRRVREQGQVEFFELEGRTLDGTLLHLVENVRGVFDEEGRLTELRGHVIDVTERRALEEQLQQAQRLEAVGRLAGGIAHDFNNLLTTVTGHTDLLLSDDRLPPELRDDLRRIKQASQKAARLTSQLVAFSRKESLEPVTLDLNRVIRDVAEMLERTIGEDVHLELDLDSDLQPVMADPGQLEQVLMNLVLNARDAMPRGGELDIVTENVEFAEDDPDRPGELDPGRYAAMTVEDTGTGISDEELDRIFEPFYTTKGPGKGSGLGLAMVYGIARQSGGHVTVRSEVGEGTAFTVFLPPEGEDGEEPEARPPREVAGEEGSWSILLIQHDPVVRKLVRRILQREGHSVLEADDPEDALAFVREWQGPIDGVVSDLLAAEHERRLRTALNEHRPGTRILWTRETSTEGPPPTGSGEATVAKPFSSQELSRKVQAVLSEASDGASGAEESP